MNQATIDDYEGWKKMGIALSYDPAYEAMGGKIGGGPLQDPSGISVVLNDFRKNKEIKNLLEKERDDVLYPFVNAVCAALEIPADPQKLKTVTDAIKAKGGAITKAQALKYVTENLK